MSDANPVEPGAPAAARQRTVRAWLALGMLTGAVAAGAAGALDAIWSWRAASQFVPHLATRARFVLYAAASHATAGALVGLVAIAAVLLLARGSRLGELTRFAAAEHAARRARDPRTAVAGAALVLAGLPVFALALAVCYARVLPYVGNRHEMSLVVIVTMVATAGALLVAVPVALLAARAVEAALAAHPRVARVASSPVAPPLAAAALVALGCAGWAWRSWETARLLPLRAPFIAALAVALAYPCTRLAVRIAARTAPWRPAARRAAFAGFIPLLVALTLGLGGSDSVMKAASAYTGLGGSIARTLRGAFDWDRDGYARFLGGGDCDDLDRDVHPGAPEIPDDGIDQNCIGGDAHVPTHTAADAAFAPVPPTVPHDFDVLLITIDTTRADHLGAYGYTRPTSPNLDALAASGQLFENGWAHAPSTRYSMPAILTGRLPLDVHYGEPSVVGWPSVSLDAVTIAESLKPLGFTTGAITSYRYFDRSSHLDQGIDDYDNEDAKLHTTVTNAGPEQTHGSSSQQNTDKALAFLDRHANQRWFLWVHYYDPHYAYEPHSEVPSFGTDRMALYDGEIRFTDMHIGRLLDGLKQRGLSDKTVVVVTGDHGEGFGEHGVELHGYHLYAAQTKVPLIFRVPGLPVHHARMPAGHVDILPTLVNLAGGQPTAEMMGQSLVPALASADGSAANGDRVVFQQLSYENNHEMRAAVSQQCHVIYNVSPDTSWEVYRVDRDPMETTDLASDDDECGDTRTALEHWYDASTVPVGAAEALLPQRPAIAAPLDADFGDAIRLLALEVGPTRARAGEKLTLTWTFAARGHPAAGWKLFVHVEDPRKEMVANGDHEPARPFTWWRDGQYIRYTTTITLPRTAANGTYNVWVGLFHGNDRAPAHAPHAKIDHDAVLAATFDVGMPAPQPPPGTANGSSAHSGSGSGSSSGSGAGSGSSAGSGSGHPP